MTAISMMLLTQFVGFAKDVLTKAVVRMIEVKVTEKREAESKDALNELVPVKDQGINKEYLRQVIDDASSRFDSLLETSKQETMEGVKFQSIVESIQEVQARVAAMKILLNLNTLDFNISMQLVITTLNPLQVSLEIAKLRLTDWGDLELWDACYIIGTSALISGYAFLGQDVPSLREELLNKFEEIQQRVLDEVAVHIIKSGNKIPWTKVPHLISPEGIDDLSVLYKNTLSPGYDASVRSVHTQKLTNFAEMSLSQLRDVIHHVKDADVLQEAIEQERRLKNRPPVLEIIRLRAAELELNLKKS